MLTPSDIATHRAAAPGWRLLHGMTGLVLVTVICMLVREAGWLAAVVALCLIGLFLVLKAATASL